MNDHGFTVCVNKKKNKRKHKKFVVTNDWFGEDDLTKEQLICKVNDCVEELKESLFFEDLSKMIESKLDLEPRLIVCYGLGRISASSCSRYQLALLSLLRSTFGCQNVLVYDPVFTDLEKDFLINHFQCEIIIENERCKRRVDCEPVLFFMPHCDKTLFNNLLWINWEVVCLSNVIILGNSFQSMIDSIVTKEVKAQFTYITNALDLKLVNECQIENNFKLKDIFNDLSLHLFPVSEIDENILKACYSSQSPVYSEDSDVI